MPASSFVCDSATVYFYAPVGGEALSGDRHLSSVCLSDVAYNGSNSETKRPRTTKLCTGVPQVTCDSHTDYKSKGQKSRSRGGGILWRPPSRTACLTCLSFSHMIFLYLCLLMFDNFVCDSATVYFFNMSFIHMIFLYLCLLMFDF